MPQQHIYDVVLLTQKEFVNPKKLTPYIENVLIEDELLTEALKREGLSVGRIAWDNPEFDFSSTSHVVFRAIWDYYHRYSEFDFWLTQCKEKTNLINSDFIIQWNIDKHYLLDLQRKNIAIPPTIILEQGDLTSLSQLVNQTNWKQAVLKPAVGGAARHAYLFDKHNVHEIQQIFDLLITKEAMLVQEYQYNITNKGELSFMVFGGQFSHAVLKRAKQGDFRVQDDYGGTVYPYTTTQTERDFAEQVVLRCGMQPAYARVDAMWNNDNQLCVSELELIEPELWLRTNRKAALLMAQAISIAMK